jgi:hypothetical protein
MHCWHAPLFSRWMSGNNANYVMDPIRPSEVFKEASRPRSQKTTLTHSKYLRLGPCIVYRRPDVWGMIPSDLLLGCRAKAAWRCREGRAGPAWEAPSRGSS